MSGFACKILYIGFTHISDNESLCLAQNEVVEEKIVIFCFYINIGVFLILTRVLSQNV